MFVAGLFSAVRMPVTMKVAKHTEGKHCSQHDKANDTTEDDRWLLKIECAV